MSNLTNEQKAIYALLADNVYWDVRKGFTEVGGTDDFTNSNWTPVPDGWTVIDEISGSGEQGKAKHPELEGFTARVFKNTNTDTGKIVISFAGTEDFTKSPIWKGWSGDGKADASLGLGFSNEQANQAALLYQKIRHENPNADISFTGHSLGGGLAGLMGLFFDTEAVIFDHAPFKKAAINVADVDLSGENSSWIPESVKAFLSGAEPTAIFGSTLRGIQEALNQQIEINKQTGNGFTQIDNSLKTYDPTLLETRANNKLTAIAVKGEALSFAADAWLYEQLGLKNVAELLTKNDYIIDGKSNAGFLGFSGATPRHSQTLMVATLLDENFEHYTSLKESEQGSNYANLNTLKYILDEELYGYDPKKATQNFLVKLVRSHIGVDGGVDFTTDGTAEGVSIQKTKNSLLTGFGLDLKNVAEALGGASTPYVSKYSKLGYDTLIVQAIQSYYYQDIKLYDGKQFFTTSDSYIQYTPFQDYKKSKALGIGETAETNKANPYIQKWIAEAYLDATGEYLRPQKPPVESEHEVPENITTLIFNYDQWNVALNGKSMGHALDKDKSQLLVSINLETDVKFTSGDKNDYLLGSQFDDEIDGQGGDDKIYGGIGNDTLKGGAGNDQINGGKGEDILKGEAGQDYMYGGDDNDTLDGGVGNDTLIGGKGILTADGGEGNDYIIADKENDTDLKGGAGNDIIDAGKGEDHVKGGQGNDTLIGGDDKDKDILEGEEGNDLIVIDGLGDDILKGGNDSDLLMVDTGRSFISFFDGKPQLEGGNGSDRLIGNTGKEKYIFSSSDLGTDSIKDPDGSGTIEIDGNPHCQNSCHPYLNNLNGGKGDNHGTIQSRTQTSNIKQTAIA